RLDLRLQRRVGRQLRARGLAPEAPARHSRGLPADIPERDVERTECVYDGAAATRHGAADVEVLPDPFRLERIASDQHLPEASVHRVRPGCFDAGTGDPGV